MIKIKDIIINNGWKATYDTFNIDFSIPFSEQTTELNEDLFQATKGGYTIDIGWYPEGVLSGKIVVKLIKNLDWVNPIKQYEGNNYEEIKKFIYNVVCSID